MPEEPAGRISTRAAGLVEVRATLSWRNPDDAPGGRVIPAAPDDAGPTRCVVVERGRGAVREVRAEVRAFSEVELGAALDAVLRSLSAAAVLWDAALEARAVRLARPLVVPASALEGLARDLWGAGFPVRFGPSWAPVPGGALPVGAGGDAGAELEGFLRGHPRWSLEKAGAPPGAGLR